MEDMEKKLKQQLLKKLMEEMDSSMVDDLKSFKEGLKPAVKIKEVKEDVIPLDEVEEEFEEMEEPEFEDEEELPEVDPNSIEELEQRLAYLKKKQMKG